MITISTIQSKEELMDHLDTLTNTLSQAFYNDPYYVHIMPDDNKRISQIKWWMTILLKYTLKNGTIYITSDYRGVAMWLGPDNPTISNVKLALLGLILYPFRVGVKSFFKMLDVSTQWEKEHAKQNKRHNYLMIIGVDPALQRQGIGNKLMSDILIKADQEKLDCYLETVTKENLMFYEHIDFEVICSKKFGKDYQYWLMKRTPK